MGARQVCGATWIKQRSDKKVGGYKQNCLLERKAFPGRFGRINYDSKTEVRNNKPKTVLWKRNWMIKISLGEGM